MLEGRYGAQFFVKNGKYGYELNEEVGPLDPGRRLVKDETRARFRKENREEYLWDPWHVRVAVGLQEALLGDSGDEADEGEVRLTRSRDADWWDSLAAEEDEQQSEMRRKRKGKGKATEADIEREEEKEPGEIDED